ncbi:MAG: flagellar hook-length control protein FliK, partial [Campylobacterota bacterium]|nr:flagellar hook-length control protein FliK [Campylobacterota bacterium]
KLNNIYSNNIKIDIPIEIKETFNKILQLVSELTLNYNQNKYTDILKSITILTNNMEVLLSKVEISSNGSIFNSLTKNSALDAKSIVTNDLKATILQIEKQILDSGEKVPKEFKMQIERINNQIEYYQLLSYSSNTTHTFLPFQWSELDDADIKFNKKDTNIISCQINLSLKNKGDIKVLLQLENNKNISIDIGVEKDEFQELISNNLQKIRAGISKIGLILQNINIFSIRTHNESYQEKAYGEQKLDFGLDIKI